MTLEAFQAGKGDSFMLCWEFEGEKNSLLIDTGVKTTYKEIRRRLSTIESLQGIIITHVDYDHLGGLFALLDDRKPPINFDFTVFINTPDLIEKPDVEHDQVRISHGILLESVLNEKKIKTEPLYVGINKSSTIIFKGLKLRILSPTPQILETFKETWSLEKIKEEARKAQNNESTDLVSSNFREKVTLEELSCNDSIHDPEDDLINSSSISFIAELNGKSILFLGDSNPQIIVNELKRLNFSTDNKLHVNLVKVSHHGCRHNTSKELLSLINSSSFLISTSGAGPYYHPHRETLAKLVLYGKDNADNHINIYTNYSLSAKSILTEDEKENHKINFEQKTFFEL